MVLLKTKHYPLNTIRGAVTLPAILVISAIIMEVAIVGVIISTALLNSTNSERLSSEAFKAARAGIEDATIRVVRYCPLTESVISCPSSYPVTVGSYTATVVMEALVTVGSNYTRTITATGQAGLVRKKLQAVLSIDGVSGQVSQQSLKEISL